MTVHESLLPATTPRSAFVKLLQSEAKIAWRVPIGLIFGVAFPILLLIIFGYIPAFSQAAKALGGLTRLSVYFPILIAMVSAMLALLSLPTHLASYREQGILRRMSTTPVPPAWMLAAQVVVNLALAVLSLAILITVGTAGFGLGAPGQAAGFTLAVVLTIAAMFAIGLWVAAIARTSGEAGIIGQLILGPLLFFAGLWLPRGQMPSLLRHFSDYSPLGAGVHALQDAMQGSFPSAQSLLTLVAYTAVFAFLAARFFRWD